MTKPIDRAAMKAQTRELLQTAQVSPKGMTALYCACLFLLSLLEALIPGPELVSTFLSILTTLAGWILAAGFALYCMDIRRRERSEYAVLFDGFSFTGKIIALNIVINLFVFLWSMLFVFPGIIAYYRYSFALYNLYEDPEIDIMEALNLSKRQTFGYKWQLFVLQLSFIGWSLLVLGIFLIYELLVAALLPDSFLGIMFGSLLLSVLAAGVGVYLTPYLNLSICRFYLLATAPQVNEPPHFDSWNDNF